MKAYEKRDTTKEPIEVKPTPDTVWKVEYEHKTRYFSNADFHDRFEIIPDTGAAGEQMKIRDQQICKCGHADTCHFVTQRSTGMLHTFCAGSVETCSCTEFRHVLTLDQHAARFGIGFNLTADEVLRTPVQMVYNADSEPMFALGFGNLTDAEMRLGAIEAYMLHGAELHRFPDQLITCKWFRWKPRAELPAEEAGGHEFDHVIKKLSDDEAENCDDAFLAWYLEWE